MDVFKELKKKYANLNWVAGSSKQGVWDDLRKLLNMVGGLRLERNRLKKRLKELEDYFK